jgi:hypothetical protein
MRFVPVKTSEQQAALMLVGLRDRLIRQRTQLTNAIDPPSRWWLSASHTRFGSDTVNCCCSRLGAIGS